jgi:hypothetical protein
VKRIQVVGRKARGKETTKKTKCRWVDGSWGNMMGWCGLAQDREKKRALMNAAINLQVP